jgi:hypothetical protein
MMLTILALKTRTARLQAGRNGLLGTSLSRSLVAYAALESSDVTHATAGIYSTLDLSLRHPASMPNLLSSQT